VLDILMRIKDQKILPPNPDGALLFDSSHRYSVCLLYWYKSTNTDAEGAAL